MVLVSSVGGRCLLRPDALRLFGGRVRFERCNAPLAAISPPQWIVIIVLDALILVTIAVVHVRRHTTTAINMLISSTAVAACMVLLLIYDRPFTAGGITVQSTALQEVSSQ